jgi:hypothetical protein
MPPGGNPTIIVIARAGKSCARALSGSDAADQRDDVAASHARAFPLNASRSSRSSLPATRPIVSHFRIANDAL